MMREPKSLGHLLGQVCRLHHRRAHTLLDAIGIYRGQPPVLEALDAEDGRTHSELAAWLHVSPATVSKMIQRMEKSALVERRDDPQDQRVSRVYLTAEGRRMHAELQQVLEALRDETFAHLSAEERTTLRRLLLQVRKNLLHATGHDELDHT
jgi:DNA-binding MarR family transcriptional regulator